MFRFTTAAMGLVFGAPKTLRTAMCSMRAHRTQKSACLSNAFLGENTLVVVKRVLS